MDSYKKNKRKSIIAWVIAFALAIFWHFGEQYLESKNFARNTFPQIAHLRLISTFNVAIFYRISN